MVKRTRDNIGWVMAIMFIIAFVGVAWFAILCIRVPNKDSAEEMLKSDEKWLQIVVQYLECTNDDSIYINKWDKNIICEKIDDEETCEAIKRLFRRGYDGIGKRGNTIYFIRWTFWRDFGAGISYSIDIESEPMLEYLVKLEPLSKKQWYYYECN